MGIFAIIDVLAGRWLDWRMERAAQSNPDIAEFNLKRAEMGPDGFFVTGTSPAIAILADEAAQMLERNNAKNYVQFDMMPRLDRGLKAIRVTVQWAGGESPASKAARLEREIADAHLVLDSLGALVGLGREYSVDQRIDDLMDRVAQRAVSESQENAR